MLARFEASIVTITVARLVGAIVTSIVPSSGTFIMPDITKIFNSLISA
jgi:hypothetical protein